MIFIERAAVGELADDSNEAVVKRQLGECVKRLGGDSKYVKPVEPVEAEDLVSTNVKVWRIDGLGAPIAVSFIHNRRLYTVLDGRKFSPLAAETVMAAKEGLEVMVGRLKLQLDNAKAELQQLKEESQDLQVEKSSPGWLTQDDKALMQAALSYLSGSPFCQDKSAIKELMGKLVDL